MIPRVWINRGAAAATAVLAVFASISAVAIARDLSAVNQARHPVAFSSTASRTAAPVIGWIKPAPALRLNRGEPKIAIGEYLNGQLADAGLSIVALQVESLRPLGGGLKLAQVRIETRGDAKAVAAAANWVAINHDALRLKSLSMGLGPNDEGQATLVLMMVVA